MKQQTIRLPADLIAFYRRMAKVYDTTYSEVIRNVLAEKRKSLRRQHDLNRLGKNLFS